MAVAKTGAMFKSLTFDGYSSRDYGVYITGEAVYNAPERAVEMISIPNRNGAFALDEGHFENIEVTYPAGVFADNEADFADAISDFRNLLCSRKGYCTLTDEYHPDEYREAVYKSGLEVTPSQLRAGEFTITFECKPQRFLNSGTVKSTVTSGSTITNPTLFESNPFLEVKGKGTITMDGHVINVNDVPLGMVTLQPAKQNIFELYYNNSLVQNGDPLYFDEVKAWTSDSSFNKDISSISGGLPSTYTTNADMSMVGYWTEKVNARWIRFYFQYIDASFTTGTTGYLAISVPFTITFTDSTTTSITYGHHIDYIPGSDEFDFYKGSKSGQLEPLLASADTSALTANSSVSALGNPTYIDCEIGEAYKIENDQLISLDNAVELGANLPVLGPGSNTITYSNTITELKVTPRWWKI